MFSSRVSLILALLTAIALSGCSSRSGRFLAPSTDVQAAHLVGPVAWHAGNERQCLASGRVQEGRFIKARAPIGRPSGCGAERPFVMSAAVGGTIAFRPAATLRCPMIAPVENWFAAVVQPAARRYLGQRVIGVKVAASYACRSRNHRVGAKLSEHGRANAIDISAFHLADGRSVTLKNHWHSTDGRSRFLRAVHVGACRYFSTVLGPDADRNHQDHFHMDLARHGRNGTYRVCR